MFSDWDGADFLTVEQRICLLVNHLRRRQPKYDIRDSEVPFLLKPTLSGNACKTYVDMVKLYKFRLIVQDTQNILKARLVAKCP